VDNYLKEPLSTEIPASRLKGVVICAPAILGYRAWQDTSVNLEHMWLYRDTEFFRESKLMPVEFLYVFRNLLSTNGGGSRRKLNKISGLSTLERFLETFSL
jgi:hypothetical protein